MRRKDIIVEHYYKTRFLGQFKVRPGKQALIGRAKSCDIRLLGEGVSGVHAAISNEAQGWKLLDLCSDQGTWVSKEPIVELLLDEEKEVRIGHHKLKIRPIEVKASLFVDEAKDSSSSVEGAEALLKHQVIVRKNNQVIETHLLEETESFVFKWGHEEKNLAAPKGNQWEKTELSNIIVQQRLVEASQIRLTPAEKMVELFDGSLKKPLASALSVFCALLMVVALAPSLSEEEIEEVKPDKVNKYARVVYDAKSKKRQKKEAIKVQKVISKTAHGSQSVRKRVGLKRAGKRSAKSIQVVNKIKASGLSALIGKISKRAASNAQLIQALGKAPEKAKGRALASVGGTVGKKSKAGTALEKLKNVKTLGMAGGSGSYKGSGRLESGSLGHSSVGILEEETEIQGGLDRGVIARVIESQLGQIRYCYERQLSANPNLYGKVLVKFTISGGGSVMAQSIGNTTLNSAMVEGCILRRVAGWRFPKPKGGTNVLVTYPFLFKSTN